MPHALPPPKSSGRTSRFVYKFSMITGIECFLYEESLNTHQSSIFNINRREEIRLRITWRQTAWRWTELTIHPMTQELKRISNSPAIKFPSVKQTVLLPSDLWNQLQQDVSEVKGPW